MQWWFCINNTEQYSDNVLHCIAIYILCLYYILFRNFYHDGDYYIGGYRQGQKHGKGENEWADGDREIAYYVNDKREGKAKYYCKDGTEKDRMYKNDKVVEE